MRCVQLAKLSTRTSRLRRLRTLAPGRAMEPAAAPAAARELCEAKKYRVLAFEDNYDIASILKEGGVEHGVFEQRWTTDSAVDAVRAFRPDVLMLDHYIPPLNGLQVLQAINAAVRSGDLQETPAFVLGMSSVQRCNDKMLAAGADAAFIKWEAPAWAGWARRRAESDG